MPAAAHANTGERATAPDPDFGDAAAANRLALAPFARVSYA